MGYKYDVAISFAEEDRNAALALALALEIEGFSKIYYYPDQRTVGWGQELETFLTNVYSKEAKYSVVLLSENYFDTHKLYTKIELEAIKLREKQEFPRIYMLPVMLDSGGDCSKYPVISKLKHLPWNYDPKGIASSLKQLLGGDFKGVKEKMKSMGLITISGHTNVVNIGNNIGKQKISSKK